MKFKIQGDVEKPELGSDGVYYNVRSNVRVDVRPNEDLLVDTGISVFVNSNEQAVVVGFNGDDLVLEPGKWQQLKVKIVNKTERSFMIYQGQVIGYIITSQHQEEMKKPKSLILNSSAALEIPEAPGFYKKGCGGCN